MATGESDGPKGIYMSLDQIIEENSKGKKLHSKSANRTQHYGKSNQSQQSFRGRGRGGNRGQPHAGRSFGRGGRGQQQNYHQYPPAERIVMIHDETPNLEYRQYQDCYRDDYGNVIFSYKHSELVKVSRAGDVTLNARADNGREFRGITTLKSLNDALNCLNISITSSNPKFPSDPAGYWNVLDGRALLRYRDGLTLPAKGPQHAGRGQALMAAIKHSGIPQASAASAATAASNAAAAQAGLLPPGAYGFGAEGFAQPFMQAQYPYSMAVPTLAGRLPDQNGDFGYSNGMGYGVDSAQIRRDKARGRHMPY